MGPLLVFLDQCSLLLKHEILKKLVTYIESMVLTYMQRKVDISNTSNDEYTKVNGRMINKMFTTGRN